MNKKPEDILKNLSTSVSLSREEHAAGRAHLRAFMDAHPMIDRPVRSPFGFLLAPTARYAFGFLFVFSALGGGTALAENAQPGDALYAVKLKVNEPVQLAVTLDPQKKTALRVAIAEERLKELAKLAVHEEDARAAELAAGSLAEQVTLAQEEITTVHAQDDARAAYKLARDLSGVISSHAEILAAVEADADVTRSLAEEINQNDAIEKGIATTLEVEELVVSIKDAQDGAVASLSEVRAELTNAQETLDTGDLSAIEKRISAAEVSVASAKSLDESGKDAEALILYADAAEAAEAITDLIEAEKALKIDLIQD